MSEREAVPARGPWASSYGYSRAVRSGPQIEVSGTTAIGPDGTPVAPGGCDLLLPELLVEIEASAVVAFE